VVNSFRVALIPGDGIGREVLTEGVKVMEAAASRFDFRFNWTEFDWSCERFHRVGEIMPADGVEQLHDFDAIYFGAVGFPGVPDHVSLWNLLIPMRRGLKLYVNLRPVRLLPGMVSPLRDRGPGDINYLIVRENNEGEYSEVGGRVYTGTEQEAVIQQSVFTRIGTDRIQRFAFELAAARRGHLTSATKSNGIIHSMPYWDERFEVNGKDFPEVTTDQYHIDILSARLVLSPDWFDVIVASNLFGDILSDLGPATTGTIAIAPSANLNPEREFPSLFEPVHGSAPDIAGKGIANPIGQIWSGVMMLDHLGEQTAANAVMAAIEELLASPEGVRTPDIGGNGSCWDVGEDVARIVARA
jgi:tartrate dehydrogenase/decarboxylase/D-malate dehydrogenase